MIDSGAYSAFRLGKKIDIKHYCAWLHANLDWIDSYVNLDHIDPTDTTTSARISFENLLTMRAAGLDPIPVFHAGEDLTWLYRMLDLGCSYVGLAASAMNIRGKVDDWYAGAWQPLADKNGLPIVKVHGFGEGRAYPLQAFPWHSVDTASWIFAAQAFNGGVTRQAVALASFAAAEEYHDLSLRIAKTRRVLRHRNLFLARSDKVGAEAEPLNLHLAAGNNPCSFAAIALARHDRMLISFNDQRLPWFARMRDYVNDPDGIGRTDPLFSEHYNYIKEHLYAQ